MLVLFDFDPKINNHIHIWSDIKLKDYEISSTLIKILDFFVGLLPRPQSLNILPLMYNIHKDVSSNKYGFNSKIIKYYQARAL